MPIAADRLDFNPPPQKGSLRALGLALLVHGVLIAALTWGVSWKSTDDAPSAFAAELWTSTPLPDAVPRQPTPVPPAPPTPTPPPPRVVETPVTPDVDIALEQEKKRKLERDKKLAEDAARDKREQLQAEKAEAARLAKLEKAKDDAKKAQQAREQATAKAAEDKKLQAQKDAREAASKQASAKAAEQQRQDNLKRLQGLAGATGETDGNSTSKASSGGKGTSRTYAAIASAAIRKNVVFIDETYGNPLTKVEVRITSDGTITSQRIVQPSGNKAWDDAALNAVVRTRVMPRDVDGGFPDSILILEMRPRG